MVENQELRDSGFIASANRQRGNAENIEHSTSNAQHPMEVQEQGLLHPAFVSLRHGKKFVSIRVHPPSQYCYGGQVRA
jgi:hypothetical protein